MVGPVLFCIGLRDRITFVSYPFPSDGFTLSNFLSWWYFPRHSASWCVLILHVLVIMLGCSIFTFTEALLYNSLKRSVLVHKCRPLISMHIQETEKFVVDI